MAAVLQHVVLALVLTGVLACQARAFAEMLRSHRALDDERPLRVIDLVWIVIPVAVVLFLAARSWIATFDLSSPAMAVVAPIEVSTRPISLCPTEETLCLFAVSIPRR